jgi:hypothetical protein
MKAIRLIAVGLILTALTGCHLFQNKKPVSSPTGVKAKSTAKSSASKKSSSSTASKAYASGAASKDKPEPSWFGSLFKKEEPPKQQSVNDFVGAKRPE